jgi:hypothetical protein
VLLPGGDVRRKNAAAKIYDNPHVLKTKKIEAEFATRDAARRLIT